MTGPHSPLPLGASVSPGRGAETACSPDSPGPDTPKSGRSAGRIAGRCEVPRAGDGCLAGALLQISSSEDSALPVWAREGCLRVLKALSIEFPEDSNRLSGDLEKTSEFQNQ